MNKNPVSILLVEDNDGDARLALEALKYGDFQNKLFRVNNGVEAMQFLKKEGDYPDVPRPDLILLDLNMPLMDGREVLQKINKIASLATIPLIVLTTSENENDIFKSYSLNANCYISKPIDFERFVDVVKSIEHFWFSIASLPDDPPR